MNFTTRCNCVLCYGVKLTHHRQLIGRKYVQPNKNCTHQAAWKNLTNNVNFCCCLRHKCKINNTICLCHRCLLKFKNCFCTLCRFHTTNICCIHTSCEVLCK